MYCINDQQIDYILDDIRRRGVETEDLQLNLLDHICCLVEHHLKEEEDFEDFYQQTIKQFYKKELRELEEETLLLLTFKNYYLMKKIMLVSGGLAMLAFVTGSIFKILHWPGASILITLGIVTIAFLFLPLLFILKAKEVNTGLERLTIALGALLGILFSLDVLFTVNHWPGANIMWMCTIGLSFFIFIPLYCFSGMRRPETRTNTLLTTIMLIGFTTLFFAMLRLRGPVAQRENSVGSYLQNERIWNRIEARVNDTLNGSLSIDTDARTIIDLSAQLKSAVLEHAIGSRNIAPGTAMKSLSVLEDRIDFPGGYFNVSDAGINQLENLKQAVARYNKKYGESAARIPEERWMKEPVKVVLHYDNLYLLNSLTQLQIYLGAVSLSPAGKPVSTTVTVRYDPDLHITINEQM